MPRERLTLDVLIERRTFDPSTFRHRRALDESGPLEDPEIEEQRQLVLDLRRVRGARVPGAEALQEFARLLPMRGLVRDGTASTLTVTEAAGRFKYAPLAVRLAQFLN
jgi:hypothetical protein